ncbi:hypothetical protein HanRHA438_Chr15g0701351 [Helianthus annuus]|uniref:Uncharacterized protein n=1 Tax=Helianthus annuus TaxID=4232 RepID=A0A251S7U8_HELAN|nr:hypothetical protein HanXRQr2_Chr15g0688981 [Helianthus annuus]KAJ0450885.1 hypothetical protein HanHA300_Chr15g0561301 [Helianthus annuus]KAJ0455221.1 hypothetical protein HanIR_Chr15g0748751 [Helianthus annuus]KAJ0472745.1 hypothetical protein HanHA89_Chr15g0610511 [Helianthus annuus]KAJ0648352.1 hypothetical protein HanLR1_Chr15g0571921 [Helianthus annuus]
MIIQQPHHTQKKPLLHFCSPSPFSVKPTAGRRPVHPSAPFCSGESRQRRR